MRKRQNKDAWCNSSEPRAVSYLLYTTVLHSVSSWAHFLIHH